MSMPIGALHAGPAAAAAAAAAVSECGSPGVAVDALAIDATTSHGARSGDIFSRISVRWPAPARLSTTTELRQHAITATCASRSAPASPEPSRSRTITADVSEVYTMDAWMPLVTPSPESDARKMPIVSVGTTSSTLGDDSSPAAKLHTMRLAALLLPSRMGPMMHTTESVTPGRLRRVRAASAGTKSLPSRPRSTMTKLFDTRHAGPMASGRRANLESAMT
mmetsp:Transcript_23421/g.88942  ORF Transcript_23421/g.88942 Transcript_23421/m.88942 type:complete len:222 (+) Transcript_23421:2008-2673(+)